MSPVQPRVPPYISTGYLFDCYYYVVIDSKFSVSTGLLPKCGEIKTFYPTGSRFFARLPLTFVTHSLARCSLSSLCYILDTHLFNFPSNCFVSNVSLTRDKDFLFKPKWISYQISSVFALIAQVILFQLLFLSPEISKLKFLRRKAPGSIPLLVFRLTCCVTEVKKSSDKGQKKKKAMGVPRNGRKNPPWGQGNERNSSRIYFLIFFLLTVF